MSKIILTFEFDSVAEAAKLLSAMAGNVHATVAANAKPTETLAADVKPEKAKDTGKVTKAEKPASQQAAADSSQPATGAASSASSTEGSTSAGATGGETIPYSDLQKAVFAVAALGAGAKTAVLALAAQLGAPTFKELPAAKWAEAKALVEALHAELTAEVA